MEKLKKYLIFILVLFVFFMFYDPIICFIILGVFFSAIGIYFLFFLKRIKERGIKSRGKILFFESDSEGYKTPIIEYTTNRGKVIKEKPFYYTSSDLSIIRSYRNKINEPISISYDPMEPKKFILNKENNTNFFSLLLFTLIGLIFVLISILNILGIININF